MHILRPSADRRLNLLTGLLSLIGAGVLAASLLSHSPEDPAWNTAAEALRPHNWIGYPGALFSDVALSLAGFASWLIPIMVCLFGLRRMRSKSVEAPGLRVFGAGLLVLSACTLLSLAPDWKPLHETMPPGGVVGLALSAYLLANLNFGGTLAIVAVAVLISIYLTTSFTVETVEGWIAAPMAWWDTRVEGYQNWLDRRRARSEQNRLIKEAKRQSSSLPDPPPPEKKPRKVPVDPPAEETTSTFIPIVPLEEAAAVAPQFQVPTPAMVTVVARATLHASVAEVPAAGAATKCAKRGALELLPEVLPRASKAPIELTTWNGEHALTYRSVLPDRGVIVLLE